MAELQKKHLKDGNIYHFVSYYQDFCGDRIFLERPDLSKPEVIIDELHNLRLHYDRQGLFLKRIDTKRRYYKRVRADARFASSLPRKINGWVDALRKVGKPAQVIDFPYGRRVLGAREKKVGAWS